jgi:hypothetical protein
MAPLRQFEDQGGDGAMEPREERSLVPQRQDMCRIFVSGIVGTEPKEAYLKHGHYVVNFAVATVGHFTSQHDWERFKPTEVHMPEFHPYVSHVVCVYICTLS